MKSMNVTFMKYYKKVYFFAKKTEIVQKITINSKFVLKTFIL